MRDRERGDEAFPCVSTVGVVSEYLAVEGVGLVGVVADEIDGRQLQFERDAGLAAGRDLKFYGALEQPLRDFELIGLLIDGAEHGQEAGIGQRGFVGRRGHLLDVGDSLSVLAHLMLGADEAFPGGDIGGIALEHLRIERESLIVMPGVHQDAGVLQLGADQQRAAVIGEWQREREGEDALRIGGAVLGLIDACECVEIFGILIERGFDLRGKTRGEVERFGVLIVVRVGEEEAAPCFERSGLDVKKLLIDGGCGGVMLLFGVDAGEAVEGIGTARVHLERGTELGGGKIELILVHSLRAQFHGEPEARGGQRSLDNLNFVAVVLGLH